MEYSQGKTEPDPADLFPKISLSLELGGLTGPLLTTPCSETCTRHKADKKTLYCNSDQGTDRSGLRNRRPLCGQRPGPEWRISCKPALKERTAHL